MDRYRPVNNRLVEATLRRITPSICKKRGSGYGRGSSGSCRARQRSASKTSRSASGG